MELSRELCTLPLPASGWVRNTHRVLSSVSSCTDKYVVSAAAVLYLVGQPENGVGVGSEWQ